MGWSKQTKISFRRPPSSHERSGDASLISVNIKFNALKHPSHAEINPLLVIRKGPWNVVTPATTAQSAKSRMTVIFIIFLGTSLYPKVSKYAHATIVKAAPAIDNPAPE
jgi:hypothetical protein